MTFASLMKVDENTFLLLLSLCQSNVTLNWRETNPILLSYYIQLSTIPISHHATHLGKKQWRYDETFPHKAMAHPFHANWNLLINEVDFWSQSDKYANSFGLLHQYKCVCCVYVIQAVHNEIVCNHLLCDFR